MIKVKIFLMLAVIVSPVIAFSQTADNTNRHNEKNIYYQALVRCVSDSSNASGKVPDSIFIQSYAIDDSLLPGINHIKFVRLSYPDVIAYLRHRKGITIYYISPLSFKDGVFSITIIPYAVSYKEKEENALL